MVLQPEARVYGVVFGMFLIVLAVPSLFMFVHHVATTMQAALRALAGTAEPGRAPMQTGRAADKPRTM